MQEWHFKISANVLIPGDSNEYNINPENFTSLIRISDYLEKNTPMILARITVDKNLFDKMIENAKTATIHLKIDKFNKNVEGSNYVMQPYIDDEFYMFISNDINYNKELDYIGNEADQMEHKDVYKQVTIGMMSKQCVDENKNVANSCIYNTTMMNIVASNLKDTHLLLEPFTYNKEQKQLVIPPQDTLVQVIEFLNSVNVFYDTKYMFFIDEPFCTYLISRSGNGIGKSDELYTDVTLYVHKTTDKDVAIPGMEVDNEHQQYYVDINVLDTKYTIDHDTAKIVDKLEAIINPSKDNTPSLMESILGAKGYIQRIMNTVNDAVGNFLKDNINVVEEVANFNIQVAHSVNDVLGPLTDAQEKLINSMKTNVSGIPTSVTVQIDGEPVQIPIMESSFTSGIANSLGSALNGIKSNYSQMSTLQKSMENIEKKSQSVLYQAQAIKSSTGAVSYVNAQDVVNNIDKKSTKLDKDSTDLENDTKTKLTDKKSTVNNYSSQATSAYNTGVNLVNKMNSIKAAATNYVLPSSLLSTFDSLATNVGQLEANMKTASTHTSNIINQLDGFDKKVKNVKDLSKSLKSMKSSIKEIKNLNIKSKFTNITNDFRSLEQTATNALHNMSNLGNIGTILNYADLFNIATDLNKVADISGIGRLGVSKFEAYLQVGGNLGSNKIGTKVIRTKNDNPNEVKNVKSELESMINQLSVNKYDLDPSVFTPNKRYLVKNYDAHNNKDGKFLLNKKTEVYVREDDTFTCNTMLDLCKVVEQSTTDKAEDTSTPNTNSSNEEDWKKQSSGTVVDSTKTVSTDGTTGNLIDKGIITNQNVTNYTLGTESLTDMVQKIRKDAIKSSQ